jgi:transposase
MKGFELTTSEKLSLEAKHRKTKDRKKGDRIKAVLLRSESWTIPMIAQALRLHESTVSQHLEDYLHGKLKNASGGSDSLLNGQQTMELISHLENNTYQSTREIIHHIYKKYGVSYSIPGLNKWLHRHGFSYKKPKGYPHKACKESQARFIEYYAKLKDNISPEDEILFMDSCHPSQSTKLTYGWIKKGVDKPLATTASRTRVNLVGALSLNNVGNPIVASYERINGDTIIDFLYFVRQHSKITGTIHLILDQAGYHKSADVVSAARQLNIRLIYLPPYSPNLNPIERLWKVMNQHARNNKFFETANDFIKAIDNFFIKTLPSIADTLPGRINDNFQSLNYAF